MSHVICRSTGGTVCLPDPRTIMIDRADGGQLVVNPPRRVWDRTALEAAELTQWNFLVAAMARAMLETLPQLDGGCINYWDAGNWALNPDAEPAGPKTGVEHRVLHQHLIGRSPRSMDPSWRWGESPLYPLFTDRFAWSLGKAPLSAAECGGIVARLALVLGRAYGLAAADIPTSEPCRQCEYPTPVADLDRVTGACRECLPGVA